MNITENYSFLLLMPKTHEIFPLAGIALTATQNTARNLGNTQGSLLVSNTGAVLKIREIKRKGFLGDTFISKMKSALFGVYAISVELDSVEMDFLSLKKMIADFIQVDLKSSDPMFDYRGSSAAKIELAILQAESVEEIFRIIRFPPVTDCLDML